MHHEIPVILIEGLPVPQIPVPSPIRVGDTVSYTSTEGDVTIEFELPFSDIKDVIPPGGSKTFTRAGNFFCKCYLDPFDGSKRVGWTPETPKAGGEHDVRP